MKYCASRLLLILSCGAQTAFSGAVVDPAISAAPKWSLRSGEDNYILWQADFFHVGSFTVSNGQIFAGALAEPEGSKPLSSYEFVPSLVVCLNERGEIQWEQSHRWIGKRSLDLGQPTRSKPCVDGDRVYYVSNRGELMCLRIAGKAASAGDLSKGGKAGGFPLEPDVIWQLDMPTTLGVYRTGAADVGNPWPAPVVVGDLVFCATGHGRPPYPPVPEKEERSARLARAQAWRATSEAPSFIAVDKHTGKLAWTSNAPGKNIFCGQWSSPVRAHVGDADQIIFPGGDGFLYAFEPASGNLLWKLDCNEPGAVDWFTYISLDQPPDEIQDFFFATPVVAGNMMYVGLNKDFEWPSKSPLLAIDLAAPSGSPAIKWRFNAPEFKCTYTSVAVANRIVFVTGYRSDLFALDEATGAELWHASMDSDGRNMFGNTVAHEGLVYASSDSTLTVFRATRTKEVLGQFESDFISMGTPEFVDDRMYLSAYEALFAVRLPKAILQARGEH